MAEENDLKTAEAQAQGIDSLDSLAVANFFIGLEPGVSHLKLQKLTYCAYGWYFIDFPDTNHPLVNEPVRAWKFGPVFHNL
ncbi:MAG: Panacea domain-containing protein, partial [Gammaproteobacteria bacterium]